MATLERGVVNFFDSRSEKRFGFILLPSKEEVFFHFNDGAPVKVGATEPEMETSLRNREPQKGDNLFFRRSQNRKGAKASPWCFAQDWERAEQEITQRQVYRLVKQEGAFHVKRKPVVVWEGYNLEELRQKFSQVKLGSLYIQGSAEGAWVEHWFEERIVGQWSFLDHQYDPRQLKIKRAPVIKIRMPITIARRELEQAMRHTLVDRVVGDAEVWWTSGGKPVAEAYDGRSKKSVVMVEMGEFACTTFEGKEAQELMELGRSGKVEYNDSGDPREYDDGIYHGADFDDYRFDWCE